jgi:hypothetical protein
VCTGFNNWCRDNYHSLDKSSASAFTKKMTKLGIKNKESNHVLWYENIQYKERGEQE